LLRVSFRVSLVARQKFQLESHPKYDIGPMPVESCCFWAAYHDQFNNTILFVVLNTAISITDMSASRLRPKTE